MFSRALTTALTLVTLTTLTACGDDDPAPGTGSASATSDGTPDDGDSTSDPSASGTPAATGELVEGVHLSYRLPEGFSWDTLEAPTFIITTPDADATFSIDFDEVDAPIATDGTLDEAFRLAPSPNTYVPSFKRGPDRTVGDKVGWTFDSVHKILDERVLGWGTRNETMFFTFQISGPQGDPRLDEIYDAVLASIVWK